MKTNYLAVIVCAVVYWVLGGLWYDLLFSKPWIRAGTHERSASEFRESGLDLAFHLHVSLESADRVRPRASLHMAQCEHGLSRRRHWYPTVDRHYWSDQLHNVYIRDAAEDPLRDQ